MPLPPPLPGVPYSSVCFVVKLVMKLVVIVVAEVLVTVVIVVVVWGKRRTNTSTINATTPTKITKKYQQSHS